MHACRKATRHGLYDSETPSTTIGEVMQEGRSRKREEAGKRERERERERE